VPDFQYWPQNKFFILQCKKPIMERQNWTTEELGYLEALSVWSSEGFQEVIEHGSQP
jgi:hypothetical protein